MTLSNIGLKVAMPSFYGVTGLREALGSLFLHTPNWYGKQWISTLTKEVSLYGRVFKIITDFLGRSIERKDFRQCVRVSFNSDFSRLHWPCTA